MAVKDYIKKRFIFKDLMIIPDCSIVTARVGGWREGKKDGMVRLYSKFV